MSRTDAHRPAWVQANDPLVPRRVHHDHRKGICDLEPETAHRNHSSIENFHCYWDIDWNLVRTCSCRWCNPCNEHGKQRRYWKDQLRELAKTQDREDIDIPPFIDKGW